MAPENPWKSLLTTFIFLLYTRSKNVSHWMAASGTQEKIAREPDHFRKLLENLLNALICCACPNSSQGSYQMGGYAETIILRISGSYSFWQQENLSFGFVFLFSKHQSNHWHLVLVPLVSTAWFHKISVSLFAVRLFLFMIHLLITQIHSKSDWGRDVWHRQPVLDICKGHIWSFKAHRNVDPPDGNDSVWKNVL